MEDEIIARDLQISNMRLAEELAAVRQEKEQLESLLKELKMRVLEEGANPFWHKRILARHSTEWPMLWSTIFKITNR